MISVQL